jgi:hypothetical protein
MIVRLFLVIVAVALVMSAPAVSDSVDADSVAAIESGPGDVIDLDDVQPVVAETFRAPLVQVVERVAREERAPATPQGVRVFRPPRVTFDRV